MSNIVEMAPDEILDAGAREIRRCGLYRGGFTTDADEGDDPVCGMGAMRRVALGCAKSAPSFRSVMDGHDPEQINAAAYFRAEEALAKVMVEQLGVPKVYTTTGPETGEPKKPFDIILEGNDEHAVDAEDIALCMEKAAAGLR